MGYKYKVGLVVGRFQPFHNGHKSIIDQALKECEVVVVGIGSAEESRTKRNPYNYQERCTNIRNCYQWCDVTRLHFMPLVSIGAGDSPIWGNYVINSAKFTLQSSGRLLEVYYTGTEPDRNNWLANFPYIKTIVVDRGLIPISGTELRELIVAGHKIEAKKYWPKQLSYSVTEIIKEVYKNDNSSN